jgi:hypothetical protein
MKFDKVWKTKSIFLLLIVLFNVLENFNSVSVEPFFRKKKISDEDKVS